ncbi:RimK family protein [Aeromonas simiae]|uniref:RimK family protein n=1 Tax=Aeromonas simiae TaxID=218936 RepID=UPI00266CB6B0|nr:RimK-like ATPgrasp N-terminal domain-containing protein [Aeromonas simiae]MDO2948677.1 RimK-like ATPgrasp N-terminal domain-containing protein [Aeromonas simiae]MDO2952152.1 RimK-like ATPgrasp N-terminal domain-containing protein [Aeromonas simiae]MDO2956060.1 RimK-like ATPgrasp N-terminal domain-containing protein [Aeromonas simiae]
MSTYVIVEETTDWPCQADYLLTARSYLQHGLPTTGGRARLINLCRSMEHLSAGYYCSLLAQARSHHCLPEIETLSVRVPPQPPAKLWRKLQGWLEECHEDRLCIRAIFGQCDEPALAGLTRYYYGLTQQPLQALTLKRGRHGWSVRRLESLSPLSLDDNERALMLGHVQAMVEEAESESLTPTYQLAILVDPADGRASSDPLALQRFTRAAAAQGIRAEILSPSAIERLPEFDTLWLRAETAVGHYTFEFARRAEQLQMPVVDSSRAILACSNKLYLYELMVRSGVPMPPTTVVTRRGRHHAAELIQRLGLPLIVKIPDGALGRDLAMAHNESELSRLLDEGLARSALLLVQRRIPAEFDWRIGFLDGAPLFACRRYRPEPGSRIRRRKHPLDMSRIEALPLDDVPERVLYTARKAVHQLGDGLFGVDLRQIGERECILLEIVDNPWIRGDIEDREARDLYDRLARAFRLRLDNRGQEPGH